MPRRSYTYHSLFALLVLAILYSCSVKKYIPEGELLYRGGNITVQDTVKIKNKSGLEDELKSLLYPEPNTKLLGLYPGLHYYYKSQQKELGFINRWINKKIGEEPVYLSDVKLENTEDLLENRLENSGFFYSEISSTVEKDSSGKTAETDFTVVIGKPYLLENYIVEVDSLDKLDSLPLFNEIRNSLSETVLKKGTRYDLGAFKAERNRIDQYLKNRGYYNFNANFILFQADTNQYDDKRYDLFLKLKMGVPEKSKVPYILDQVEVFPNASQDTSTAEQDTMTIDSIDFIQNKIFFKPKRLRPFILLKPGQRYDPLTSKYTSRRVASIRTYKFVNINYKEIDTITDSDGFRHLKSEIHLSPLTKNSLRAELKGVTKSNNFTGPDLSLTYINHNVFKDGGDFSIAGNFGYEKQFGGNNIGSSSLHLGIKASLIFPRLIFPGNLDKHFKYAIPKTKISIGTDYLRRSNLYSLNSYSASFGYIWNANRYLSHQLNPIDIDYVKLGKTTDQFESILDDNPFLRRSFEQQFIAGLTYSLIYNELSNSQKKGRFNFRFNFDIAGNTVNLFGKKQDDGIKTFLGLKYTQYVKGDVDLSYHYDLGEPDHTLIGRVFGGLGIPYGNSRSLPFVKQYFSGGSYSVRAFQIRSLGPGTYHPSNNENSYFDQAGDIRLEANLEYRFPIFSVIKGALFMDAGNVWLKKKNDALPGGKFTSDFINQIGVGPGFGLRVDVQGFVIRFDLAAPLKRPYADWDFEYKKPVFNFAIGYPF